MVNSSPNLRLTVLIDMVLTKQLKYVFRLVDVKNAWTNVKQMSTSRSNLENDIIIMAPSQQEA